MKTKAFVLTLCCTLLMVLACSGLLYTRLQSIDEINLTPLSEKLYTEDTKILSWWLDSLDGNDLEDIKLPASWAEVVLVDRQSLSVVSATNAEHRGQALYQLPRLLDQSAGIIEALKQDKTRQLATEDYLVTIRPLNEAQALIGFKDKTWERGLVAEQEDMIRSNTAEGQRTLLIFAGAGSVLAVLLSAIVAALTTGGTRKAFNAFHELSLGNFEAELPAKGNREVKEAAASFRRLKTSLSMALNRLGER